MCICHQGVHRTQQNPVRIVVLWMVDVLVPEIVERISSRGLVLDMTGIVRILVALAKGEKHES